MFVPKSDRYHRREARTGCLTPRKKMDVKCTKQKRLKVMFFFPIC